MFAVLIQTTNTSEFKSHWISHEQGLVQYTISDESIKLETYMYVRTK